MTKVVVHNYLPANDDNGFFIGQESGADDAAKKTVKKLQIITKAKSRKPSQ